jgi:hypothetical protein
MGRRKGSRNKPKTTKTLKTIKTLKQQEKQEPTHESRHEARQAKGEVCLNPWKHGENKCQNGDIKLYIEVKGETIPLCSKCWDKIAVSEKEWGSTIDENGRDLTCVDVENLGFEGKMEKHLKDSGKDELITSEEDENEK